MKRKILLLVEPKKLSRGEKFPETLKQMAELLSREIEVLKYRLVK